MSPHTPRRKTVCLAPAIGDHAARERMERTRGRNPTPWRTCTTPTARCVIPRRARTMTLSTTRLVCRPQVCRIASEVSVNVRSVWLFDYRMNPTLALRPTAAFAFTDNSPCARRKREQRRIRLGRRQRRRYCDA